MLTYCTLHILVDKRVVNVITYPVHPISSKVPLTHSSPTMSLHFTQLQILQIEDQQKRQVRGAEKELALNQENIGLNTDNPIFSWLK